MIVRAEVVAEARSWLDTPYVHQHRAKGVAVDCLGLLIGVCRALGLRESSFDVNGYAQKPDGESFLARCDEHMTKMPVNQLQPGDVLVLKFGGEPQHMGIVGNYVHGGLSLIHAYSEARPNGRVVEHRLLMGDRFMQPVAAYSIPGVC